jgi:hypothetical protein
MSEYEKNLVFASKVYLSEALPFKCEEKLTFEEICDHIDEYKFRGTIYDSNELFQMIEELADKISMSYVWRNHE